MNNKLGAIVAMLPYAPIGHHVENVPNSYVYRNIQAKLQNKTFLSLRLEIIFLRNENEK